MKPDVRVQPHRNHRLVDIMGKGDFVMHPGRSFRGLGHQRHHKIRPSNRLLMPDVKAIAVLVPGLHRPYFEAPLPQQRGQHLSLSGVAGAATDEYLL